MVASFDAVKACTGITAIIGALILIITISKYGQDRTSLGAYSFGIILAGLVICYKPIAGVALGIATILWALVRQWCKSQKK